MSEDWESVTKIGSKTHGGANQPREIVVRGASALNAAARSGAIVGTEKKFGAGNTVSRPSLAPLPILLLPPLLHASSLLSPPQCSCQPHEVGRFA